MSSGSLPLETSYHQAALLGEGSFASVRRVFNDDGKEFALKVFEADEDDGTIDLATLREISALRLLRGETNGHPYLLQLADVVWIDDGDLCMAMPVYPGGDLEAAIKGNALQRGKGRVVALAHKLLSVVAHLADNGVIHRDIKSENIMLSADMSTPVLIDCSLAVFERKDKDGVSYHGRSHTGDVGSAGYIAPEVYESKPYGTKADAWSIGVVLLELFRNKLLAVEKDKQSFKALREVCAALPDKPFPAAIKSLLMENPQERASARQVLGCPLFAKNGLQVPPPRIVDISSAITWEDDMDVVENSKPVGGNGKRSRGKGMKQSREEKNAVLVKKCCAALGCKDRRTYLAAEAYATRVAKQPLENLPHEDEEAMVKHCAFFAQKCFEEEKWDGDDLENPDEDDVAIEGYEKFSMETYMIAEQEIFRIMNYCIHAYEFRAPSGGTNGKKKRKK